MLFILMLELLQICPVGALQPYVCDFSGTKCSKVIGYFFALVMESAIFLRKPVPLVANMT